jgi:hypothetical protein
MTPREQTAFAAGIETARQMALAAAVSIEVRDDAREVRQQAAVAALQGPAKGLRVLTADAASPCIQPAFSGHGAGTQTIGAAYDEHVLGLPMSEGGRFRPGQSGNPAGKAKGTRNRTTLAIEAPLDGEAEALTRRVGAVPLSSTSGPIERLLIATW